MGHDDNFGIGYSSESVWMGNLFPGHTHFANSCRACETELLATVQSFAPKEILKKRYLEDSYSLIGGQDSKSSHVDLEQSVITLLASHEQREDPFVNDSYVSPIVLADRKEGMIRRTRTQEWRWRE